MNAFKLEIPSEFLIEESRCDYKIDSKMKKIWAVELDLLSELLRVCKKYNITVCGFAGTLLGTVRHEGFIPWDDDMDVCLTREEYNKLLEVAPKEFKAPYFFQTALTDREFFCGYARLRNSNTTGFIKWNDSPNYNNGIYIDIFVLDGYIKDKEKIKKLISDRTKVEKKIRWFMGNNQPSNFVKGLLYKAMGIFLQATTSYEKLVKEYNSVIMRYNSSSEYVSLMTHNENFINKYWCKKTDILDTKSVKFEFITVPIPASYDEMLTHMYGDYMAFPPIEKRGVWHDGTLIFEPDIPYLEYLRNRD